MSQRGQQGLRGVFTRRWKILALVIITEVVLISLALWTAYSPPVLSVQDSSELSNSLFQFAKNIRVVNATDVSGSYSFVFGADYNTTFTSGVPTIVEVYAALTSEQITSSFRKGVALQIDEAQVSIDGTQDSGFKERITENNQMLIDYLSYVQAMGTPGTYSVTVRLIVSTLDINYIGYTQGTQFLVSLNGTFTLV
jgi:hypothetical protein